MRDTIRNILVVDDEIELTKTIVRHLRREGYQLASANTVENAKKTIMTVAHMGNRFDLVITDLIMPVNDGVELIEWLKKSYPEISILLVSGLGDVDLLSEVIRPELDAFCPKPLTPDTVMSLIDTIVAKRHTAMT